MLFIYTVKQFTALKQLIESEIMIIYQDNRLTFAIIS